MQRECERREMMKAAEYKDGKTIYCEMTAKEIAELEAMQAALPVPQPTLEDCQAVADMAYVNSELALSILNEMEV